MAPSVSLPLPNTKTHKQPRADHPQPIILVGVFLLIKLTKFLARIKQRRWVKLDPDLTVFRNTIRRLRWYKRDELPPPEGQIVSDVSRDDGGTSMSQA